MSREKPLVSFGMPVYDGERFIASALDSLLGQDYENFELLISDNASTDGTGEICRAYERRDARIHYYRNETNLGATKNFNRLLELSRGKYLMWAGAHDLLEPAMVSRCVELLEDDNAVVLSYPQAKHIDAEGLEIDSRMDKIDTRGMSIAERYAHVIWNVHSCHLVYGLVRREALALIHG